MNKKYCIFDMDGTLVDSMPYWLSLERDYLSSHGVDERTIDSIIVRLRPMTLIDAAKVFISELGFKGTPESISHEMNEIMHDNYRYRVPIKKGADLYLAALKEKGAVLCTASATDVPLVKTCLERLGIAKYFDFMLSCEEVGKSKTFPDVFIEAARRLGAKPAEIAVFEDSLVALKTARNAGFYAMSVADQANRGDWEILCANADETIDDWAKDVSRICL